MIAVLLSAAVIGCGSHSAGPTALKAPPTGAVCMLNAYTRHCTAATYTLSVMGVDTIDRRAFRISGCHVLVSETFRVVPQPPHAVGRATCNGLRRSANDIVATGCVGGRSRTISLTH